MIVFFNFWHSSAVKFTYLDCPSLFQITSPFLLNETAVSYALFIHISSSFATTAQYDWRSFSGLISARFISLSIDTPYPCIYRPLPPYLRIVVFLSLIFLPYGLGCRMRLPVYFATPGLSAVSSPSPLGSALQRFPEDRYLPLA